VRDLKRYLLAMLLACLVLVLRLLRRWQREPGQDSAEDRRENPRAISMPMTTMVRKSARGHLQGSPSKEGETK
jgi:hypothetical protein